MKLIINRILSLALLSIKEYGLSLLLLLLILILLTFLTLLFIYLIAFTMIIMLKKTREKIHLNKTQKRETKVWDTQQSEAPN